MKNPNSNKGMNRRHLIKPGVTETASTTFVSTNLSRNSAPAEPTEHAMLPVHSKLQFNPDGTFKIVQFNDSQDDGNIDPRTLQLMEKVLDEEKPDLVVHNGDMIAGGCDTPDEVRNAIDHIAQPMEKKRINWVITFGNHDEDHAPTSGLDEEAMLDIYRSYPHNVNLPGVKGITGTGNMHLLIWNCTGGKPVFNLWLLDSGRCAPKTIAGQDFTGYPKWDWLRFDQVSWYYETSKKLERQFGRKIPSLMFIHIPLWEFRFMWYASVDERRDENHAYAVQKHHIVGERNEDESPGPFNSGMFAAILERGDVKGVFCGHDHVNTYVGNYYGVWLGYSGSVGFRSYGLPGAEKNRLRGARVFHLDENCDDVLVETHMVFAKDYGIQ